jgi:hypothetical protein
MNQSITLSDRTRELAEKRVAEEGFESVDAYIDTLVEEDNGMPEWMREELEKGIVSGDAGELTREKFDQLVQRGIARAK